MEAESTIYTVYVKNNFRYGFLLKVGSHSIWCEIDGVLPIINCKRCYKGILKYYLSFEADPMDKNWSIGGRS